MVTAAIAVLAATVTAPTLALHRVEVDVPTRDEAVLELHGEGSAKAVPAVVGQRLLIAGLEVPVHSSPEFVVTQTLSRVRLSVALARVGEEVLAVDTARVAVRWEGLGPGGRLTVALEGTLDLADSKQVTLPVEKLYHHYAQLTDYRVMPEGTSVYISALLAIYNPFAFEVLATGLEYQLEIGGAPVLNARRGGFRLRPQQTSDVLLEQAVPLVDLAAGVAGLMARRPATLQGVLGIRTPKGERDIPILLRTGN